MTACRSGDGHGGSMSTLQAENKKYQSVVGTRSKGCSTWKMQSSPENTSVAFLRRASYNSYVLGTG